MSRVLTLLVIVALGVGLAHAQPSDDKLIVAGERIGPLRLAGKLSEIVAAYGTPDGRGGGSWQGTTELTWSRIGLSVIADERSGNIVQIAVRAVEAHPWGGLATSQGIGLETPEPQVVQAFGQPTKVLEGLTFVVTFGNSGRTATVPATPRSLLYLDRGILFELQPPGAVKAMAVQRPYRAPGDMLVVPRERISGVRLGMSRDEVFSLLGGGFVETRPDEVYYWPHTGLYAFLRDNRVDQAQATTSDWAQWAGIRYATAEGLGFGSTPEQVRKLLGEPQNKGTQGKYEAWTYQSLGVVFVFFPDTDDKTVVLIGVGGKR